MGEPENITVVGTSGDWNKRDKPEEFVAAPGEKKIKLDINIAGTFDSYEDLWKACKFLGNVAEEFGMYIWSTNTYSIGGDN